MTGSGNPGEPGLFVAAIAVGSHSCALAHGVAYWWGPDAMGELGDGAATEAGSPTPTRVIGEAGWSTVSADDEFTCGLRSGELWCWGSNFYGNLGIGAADRNERLATPVRVGDATDWEGVAVRGSDACALRGGALYCWGINNAGQTGTDPFDTQDMVAFVSEPFQIGSDQDWTAVTTNMATCGLRGGGLYCFGYSEIVPDGTGRNSFEPHRIGDAAGWESVSIGTHMGCGIRAGALYCWGNVFMPTTLEPVRPQRPRSPRSRRRQRHAGLREHTAARRSTGDVRDAQASHLSRRRRPLCPTRRACIRLNGTLNRPSAKPREKVGGSAWTSVRPCRRAWACVSCT